MAQASGEELYLRHSYLNGYLGEYRIASGRRIL